MQTQGLNNPTLNVRWDVLGSVILPTDKVRSHKLTHPASMGPLQVEEWIL